MATRGESRENHATEGRKETPSHSRHMLFVLWGPKWVSPKLRRRGPHPLQLAVWLYRKTALESGIKRPELLSVDLSPISPASSEEEAGGTQTCSRGGPGRTQGGDQPCGRRDLRPRPPGLCGMSLG